MAGLSNKLRERNRFAEKHQKLVHKVVHRYVKKCSEPYDDLYQVGFIGLLKAVDRFDPKLENAFSSFAIPKIEGEIKHYLRDQVPSLKVPRYALEKFAQVKRLRKHFIACDRQLSEEQIAQKIGISCEQWQEIANLNSPPAKVSWDELLYEPDVNEKSIDDIAGSVVYDALAQLTSRHRYCIAQRYLLGKQIEDISISLKLSSANINALIAEAICLMNLYLSENYVNN
jgi:RNA polymerase sigma-B factor